eukprot:scaffold1.g5566.t1
MGAAEDSEQGDILAFATVALYGEGNATQVLEALRPESLVALGARAEVAQAAALRQELGGAQRALGAGQARAEAAASALRDAEYRRDRLAEQLADVSKLLEEKEGAYAAELEHSAGLASELEAARREIARAQAAAAAAAAAAAQRHAEDLTAAGRQHASHLAALARAHAEQLREQQAEHEEQVRMLRRRGWWCQLRLLPRRAWQHITPGGGRAPPAPGTCPSTGSAEAPPPLLVEHSCPGALHTQASAPSLSPARSISSKHMARSLSCSVAGAGAGAAGAAKLAALRAAAGEGDGALIRSGIQGCGSPC